MTQVLFVAHGRSDRRKCPGYRVLRRKAKEFYDTGVYVDIDPSCNPTHVMDVTKANQGFFDNEFDHIFIMYAPSDVLKSKQFWLNAAAWLKPGGIVHTIIPSMISDKKKDYLYGHAVAKKAGLKSLPKKRFMTNRFPAIILQKPAN